MPSRRRSTAFSRQMSSSCDGGGKGGQRNGIVGKGIVSKGMLHGAKALHYLFNSPFRSRQGCTTYKNLAPTCSFCLSSSFFSIGSKTAFQATYWGRGEEERGKQGSFKV